MAMFKFILYFVFVSPFTRFVLSDCDANTGPAGSPECVLLEPYYHKYQWATCLTDEYIRLSSQQRHECLVRSNVYCYYQCMIEIHDDGGSGPVFDDCACGRDAPVNTTTPVPSLTSAIPDWCFSPNGTECNWYRNCLEKRYPCKEEHNSYALDYAEKFCNLYNDNREHFNQIGQRWIDAVRKCLQVKLVPILRPFVHKTCDEIKEMAFNSHPGCYTNREDGAPSICDIGVTNMFWVFWTVKGALVQAPGSTLYQMLSVSHSCHWDYKLLDIGMTVLEFVVPRPYNLAISAVHIFVQSIAVQRGWDEKGILYFGYLEINYLGREKRGADENSHNDGYIKILLAPKSEYDLNAQNTTSVNVTIEAYSTTEAIKNKEVNITLHDGTQPLALKVCGDYNCTETLRSIQVPKLDQENDDNTSTTVSDIEAVTTTTEVFVHTVEQEISSHRAIAETTTVEDSSTNTSGEITLSSSGMHNSSTDFRENNAATRKEMKSPNTIIIIVCSVVGLMILLAVVGFCVHKMRKSQPAGKPETLKLKLKRPSAFKTPV